MTDVPIRNGKTVLLVEDNPDNRAIYTRFLEHYGFRVADAGTGDAALAAAVSERPDVILLDISIPGIDGWTVIRRLKEAEATRAIPVVALTAHALAEHQARARALGFDGYVAKPAPPRRVLEEIYRLLEIEP